MIRVRSTATMIALIAPFVDVKSHSLQPVGFKGKLPAGPQGGGRTAGPADEQGAPGAPGVSGWVRTYVVDGPFDSTAKKTREATCPAGKKLL
jgi:hypothetical protein